MVQANCIQDSVVYTVYTPASTLYDATDKGINALCIICMNILVATADKD